MNSSYILNSAINHLYEGRLKKSKDINKEKCVRKAMSIRALFVYAEYLCALPLE